jgi:hypothetical protein
MGTNVALRVAKQVLVYAEFRQENKDKRPLERPRCMWVDNMRRS